MHARSFYRSRTCGDYVATIRARFGAGWPSPADAVACRKVRFTTFDGVSEYTTRIEYVLEPIRVL
jgi:hypothetical protein